MILDFNTGMSSRKFPHPDVCLGDKDRQLKSSLGELGGDRSWDSSGIQIKGSHPLRHSLVRLRPVMRDRDNLHCVVSLEGVADVF